MMPKLIVSLAGSSARQLPNLIALLSSSGYTVIDTATELDASTLFNSEYFEWEDPR